LRVLKRRLVRVIFNLRHADHNALILAVVGPIAIVQWC
jgi:hypothetical protein